MSIKFVFFNARKNRQKNWKPNFLMLIWPLKNRDLKNQQNPIFNAQMSIKKQVFAPQARKFLAKMSSILKNQENHIFNAHLSIKKVEILMLVWALKNF